MTDSRVDQLSRLKIEGTSSYNKTISQGKFKMEKSQYLFSPIFFLQIMYNFSH